jgi:hypothetical protein
MAKLSNRDWGRIHAKAWRDPKFRKLLETDPTKAIKAYGKEVGNNFDKIVTVRLKPAGIPPASIFTVSIRTRPPAAEGHSFAWIWTRHS